MTLSRSAPPSPDQASAFAALGLSPTLQQVVADLGFTMPTPVQARAIPLLLAGRDLIGQGGLQGSEVGKIEIHDRFSYVAIAKASADRAIEKLGAGRIKGKKFKVGRAK